MSEQDDGYDAWATGRVKWVVLAFSLVCAFVLFFRDWNFGLWWFAIWCVGIFVMSLAAAPFIIGEWFARKRGLLWLALVLGVVHTWGIIPASYYVLKLIHSEWF